MNLTDVLANLYNIFQPNGLNNEEINFLEEKYGKLCEPLKEFYLWCGHYPLVINSQDCWIMPKDYHKWNWLKDKKEMLLLNENQSVCYTAIREQELKTENPPVYVTYDEGQNWKLCSETIDEFIKAVLIYESLFTFKYGSEEFYWINNDEYEYINNNFKAYPFKLNNWIVESFIHLYYNTSDSVICVMGNIESNDIQMFYGAVSQSSFDKLKNLLNGIGECV